MKARVARRALVRVEALDLTIWSVTPHVASIYKDTAGSVVLIVMVHVSAPAGSWKMLSKPARPSIGPLTAVDVLPSYDTPPEYKVKSTGELV
jgi:hypothetical protein